MTRHSRVNRQRKMSNGNNNIVLKNRYEILNASQQKQNATATKNIGKVKKNEKHRERNVNGRNIPNSNSTNNIYAIIKRNLYVPVILSKGNELQALIDSGSDVSVIQRRYLPAGYKIKKYNKVQSATSSEFKIKC